MAETMRTIVWGESTYPGARRDAHLYRVYFIREPNSGAVKIGISVKPRMRMAELQCAHAFELELLAYAKGDIAAERALHDEFAADRLKGEWFKGSERLMKRIREFCGEDGYMCAEFYPKPVKS